MKLSNMPYAIAIGLFVMARPPLVNAQGTPADYERAERISQWTQNKVFRTAVVPHWNATGDRFWYRVDRADGEREFVAVDALKGTRQLAFDHAKLADTLGKFRKVEMPAKKLPVDQLMIDPAGAFVRFNAFGKRYECKLPSYEIREIGMEVPATSLPALRGMRSSQRTGEPAGIRFVNQRKEAVDLYWIDPDGERKPYGTIAAGQESQIQTFAGHVWLLTDVKKKPIAVFEAAEGGGQAIVTADMVFRDKEPVKNRPSGNLSPDGKWTAQCKDYNLVLRETATGKESVLTKEGTGNDGYSGGVFWSPDSSRLIALRTSRVDERKVQMVESSPRDQLQPKLHTITYVKPGDALPIAKPHLFDVAKFVEIPVSDDLFKNPWSTGHFHWDREGREFSFLFNQRGHQTLRIVGIDGQTGKTRSIVDETSKTFVDYSGKFFLQEIDETGEIIWMSERDGWNHLYLIDRKTGMPKNPITKGDWVVRGVERVDVEKRQIWFRAGGIHAGQDPYHVHFARVNFDGTGLVVLTKGDGSHTIRLSPDGRYLIDSYSRVDLPSVTELRRTEDGGLVCALETGDASALQKAGWQMPERFVAKGRDGKTDIFGVIYRPTNFDPSKKYPVIEAIYAGPHSSFVPKDFRSFYRTQSLAELGFIVVQIDGMGTAHRSKAAGKIYLDFTECVRR